VEHEPLAQLWVVLDVLAALAADPEGTEKLVVLSTRCRLAEPQESHFISTFSSLVRNRISFFGRSRRTEIHRWALETPFYFE
jgi:hypothetical protein